MKTACVVYEKPLPYTSNMSPKQYVFPHAVYKTARHSQKICSLHLVGFTHDDYCMLMSLNKDETAVHGYHCPGGMAVHTRKVLARLRGCCSSVSLPLFFNYLPESIIYYGSWLYRRLRPEMGALSMLAKYVRAGKIC